MKYRRILAGGAVVTLLISHAPGCATFGEADPDTSEGEAVLAALEHVAALKWDARGTTTVEGRLAVAYDREKPRPRLRVDSWTTPLRRAAGGGPRRIRWCPTRTVATLRRLAG